MCVEEGGGQSINQFIIMQEFFALGHVVCTEGVFQGAQGSRECSRRREKCIKWSQ